MAQFTNQATVTYNGITVNSNIVTGEITQVLSAYKESTPETYSSGDIITYVVGIQNSGTTDYTGVTVTDDLGTYAFGTGSVTPLTYTGDPVIYTVNGQVQASPTVTAGPPLTVTGISVPAGGNATLVYRARVNEFAPLATGAVINNTVTLSGAGLTEAVTATDTVTANAEPNLSILKSLTPTTVVENGQLQYTFTIENYGTAPATTTDSVVITDVFNPIINSPLTVTLDGAVWPLTDNYTYDEATGRFSTVAGRVTVPAATVTQDPVTGAYSITPGVTVLTVSGTI